VKDFDTDQTTKRGTRLAQSFDFKLGGETFQLRRGLQVGGHALDRWRDVLGRMLADEEERAKPEHAEVDDEEFLDVFRETMSGLLEPGQQAAFERVLGNETEPLMIPDAFEVCFWAVGVVTGRPTDASMPSFNGSTLPTPEPDDSSSTADSSSPVGAASSP
jgi:hypothetical protein